MKPQRIVSSCLIVTAILLCITGIEIEIKTSNNYNVAAAYQDVRTSNYSTISQSLQRVYGRASRMRVYKLDIHSYKKELKYSGDPAFVDSKSIQHRTRCAQYLAHYSQLLDSFYQLDPVNSTILIDSIELADTFGRPESGLLRGNQHWLGDYDSCLKFKHALQEGENSIQVIKAHYCLGIAQFADWKQLGVQSESMAKIGLCLPEACTTSMLNEDPELFKVVEQIMKLGLGAKPFNQLELREIYCLPHETSKNRQYSQSTRNFFIFTGVVASICVLATILDNCTSSSLEMDGQEVAMKDDDNSSSSNNKRPPKLSFWIKLIRAFSLARNMQKLLHVEELAQPNVSQKSAITNNEEYEVFDRNSLLGSLAGMKCISLILIIATHILVGSFTLSRNLLDFDWMSESLSTNLVLASNFMPDTFFTISGLLASFFIFSAGVEKIKMKHWIALIIHRYWRLTPLYIIVLWFAKAVNMQINSGPLWDYATAENSMRRVCSEEPWSDAFLYNCDMKSIKAHCMPVAWFTANSIKYFIITPLFITAIHKSTRFGYSLLVGALVANIAIVFKLALGAEIDVDKLLQRNPEALDSMIVNFETVYLRPYSRIGPYLIGLLAGHILYRMETKQLRVKLTKNFKLLAWTWFILSVAAHILSVRISPSSLGIDRTVAPYAIAVIIAFVRPSWALLTCWFLFNISTGKLPGSTKFLSAKLWRILVRLSFSLYLIHCEILYQIYMSERVTSYLSPFELNLRPLTLTVISLFASLLMVLLFEYPLVGIEKIFAGDRAKLEQENGSNQNLGPGRKSAQKNAGKDQRSKFKEATDKID